MSFFENFPNSCLIIFYFPHFIQVCFHFLGKKTGARAPPAISLATTRIDWGPSARRRTCLCFIKFAAWNFAVLISQNRRPSSTECILCGSSKKHTASDWINGYSLRLWGMVRTKTWKAKYRWTTSSTRLLSDSPLGREQKYRKAGLLRMETLL